MLPFGLSSALPQSGFSPFSPLGALRTNKDSKDSMETILIVEDNAIVMESIAESLRVNGYNVLQALNGLEAIPLAQTHPARKMAAAAIAPTAMVKVKGVATASPLSRPRVAATSALASSSQTAARARL